MSRGGFPLKELLKAGEACVVHITAMVRRGR